jgi:hypothetical protein
MSFERLNYDSDVAHPYEADPEHQEEHEEKQMPNPAQAKQQPPNAHHGVDAMMMKTATTQAVETI